MGSLWPKHIMFELKQYRGVIFHDNEEWCKIWRKTEMGNLSNFHQSIWLYPFAQSRKCMSLKFTEELCVMTVKNDSKIEEEMTCCFKIYKEFHDFWPEHLKAWKMCFLMDCLWPKYIMLDLKQYRRVIFHDTGELCKIWRKTDLCLEKYHK